MKHSMLLRGARVAALFAVAGMLAALAGCHTIAGVGEDVSAAGHALKRAAD